MKTDGMVILSGLSGTGKSKLVTEYANALQLSSSENASRSQVRFVPVRPFWADDSDLLGYADTVNNVYRPGDSGLIDTLVDAQIHSEDLFIIVFDEMNLARVEHYFSQFLSVLEMSAGTRVLKLYNQQLESRLYNSEKYPANISIGENVLFVGTVNTDESTYQFSDKVLDRSNVMTLEMIPFGSAELLDYSTPIHVKREPVKTDDFKKMKKINPEAHLTTADKNMLWDLHQAINQVDVNVGIGWRIVKQIDQYLMNLPFDVPTLSRSNSLDMQIVQRILTKIRGSEDQIRELVGKTTPEGKHSNGKLEDILDSYDNLSKFDQSRKIIERKSRELNVYGFTV
ncbi:ATPase [Leuconostoc mesenteroides]|nr:ATPase [Leuconostoc mesenteroides]